MTKRDLKNVQILCNFIQGDLTEVEAMSTLTLKQTTEKGRSRYIKKLLVAIKEEEDRVKARRKSNGES